MNHLPEMWGVKFRGSSVDITEPEKEFINYYLKFTLYLLNENSKITTTRNKYNH
jgi:hypothetical protein